MRVVAIVTVLFAILLAVLFAGCATSDRTARPSAGLPSYVVDITVRDARVEPGRCFDGFAGFDDECHIVRIHVANPNDATVETQLTWSASDSEGGGVTRGDTAGPSSIPAQGEVDLTLRFTTKVGAPHLTQVHFNGFPNAHGQGDVPDY